MNSAHNASLGNASYSRGDKLRLCAPAHSGLPLNAVAIVAASRPSPDGFRYDLTLTGGGASGSDVQFVKEVPEEWLRSESRIATAKACAQRPWGLWLRSTPRLLVPLFQVSTAIVSTSLVRSPYNEHLLFQRRYCWGATQQQRLWRDVAAPPGLAPHGLGRVVVQRSRLKPADSIVVDGQQRTATLMLLLTAVRDVAHALDAERAAPLVRLVTGALLRPKTASPSLDAADGEALRYAYSAGLEGLAGAECVRLVPSREDRRAYTYYGRTNYGGTYYGGTYYGCTYSAILTRWRYLLATLTVALLTRRAFCSLVLGEPLDAADAATGAAARLSACYHLFRQEARQLARRAAAGGEGGEGGEGEGEGEGEGGGEGGGGGGGSEGFGGDGGDGEGKGEGSGATSAAAKAAAVGALERVARNAMERVCVVVFELEDGVQPENMYESFAQRDKVSIAMASTARRPAQPLLRAPLAVISMAVLTVAILTMATLAMAGAQPLLRAPLGRGHGRVRPGAQPAARRMQPYPVVAATAWGRAVEAPCTDGPMQQYSQCTMPRPRRCATCCSATSPTTISVCSPTTLCGGPSSAATAMATVLHSSSS